MNDFAPAVRRLLAAAGFVFARHGRGDHEIWRSEAANMSVVVDGRIRSRHTANGVLKQAGLPEAF